MSTMPLPPLPKRLAAELQRSSRPHYFSDDGFNALVTTQDGYVEDLERKPFGSPDATESTSFPRGREHIERARGRLRNESRRVAWLELFGGVLAGGGFAQLITNVAADENPSSTAWVIACVITVVGVAMLAGAIGRR